MLTENDADLRINDQLQLTATKMYTKKAITAFEKGGGEDILFGCLPENGGKAPEVRSDPDDFRERNGLNPPTILRIQILKMRHAIRTFKRDKDKEKLIKTCSL